MPAPARGVEFCFSCCVYDEDLAGTVVFVCNWFTGGVLYVTFDGQIASALKTINKLGAVKMSKC